MATVPVYNASEPWGGDTLQVDVNLQYAGLEHHYIYLILCAMVVFPILPGIGFLYGGLARRKSALTLLLQSFLIGAVITFQWMLWGYSLTYSRTSGPFIGDASMFLMRGVMAAPSPGNAAIPDIVYCFYQLLFCSCTVQIVVGGAFERGRILPSLVFGFLWATVVYCPLAYWTWNANGWLYNLPSLDFAGGGPVHIASGWSALAYAFVLGKRTNSNEQTRRGPHNVTLVFLGTVLIWFGWFGFNGGSSLNASLRSMLVVFNTNAAASTGILGWTAVDYVRHRKFSIVGACEGAIAGLVGITPAAGYVTVWSAALIGFLTAIACALCQNINAWLHVDEGLDVFKLHGVGGMVGSFLTGIFATSTISMLDGMTEASGAMDGNGMQVGKQFAEIAAISAYSFSVSCILLYVLNYIPGMKLRVSESGELKGLDFDQLFEEEIGDWTLFEDKHGKGSSSYGDVITAVSSQRGSDTGEVVQVVPYVKT